MDEPTMVDFATAAMTYEAELKVWQTAYNELNIKFESALSGFDKRLDLIQQEHDRVVESYKTSLSKAKRASKSPGFGVFAGLGLSKDGPEAVVGIGFVLKF